MTYHDTTCRWVFSTPDGCWEFTNRIPRGLIAWLNKKLNSVTAHTVEMLRQAMMGSSFHQQVLLETTGSFLATVEEEYDE